MQVVKLARKCGLVKLGTIEVDSTKLKANASRHKAMSYKRMIRAEAELKAQIEALLERAKAPTQRSGMTLSWNIPAEIERREADLVRSRREGDDRVPRNPDGTPKRGPKYKREFGVSADDDQEGFTDRSATS